jgi:hypothetical protein
MKSAMLMCHINGCDELLRRIISAGVFDKGHINTIKGIIDDMTEEVVEDD